MNRLLLYYGDVLIGDINKLAKDRHLEETLKSEASQPTADCMTFSISWKLFQKFVNSKTSEEPSKLLRVGKTRIVFETKGFVRFAGWLSNRPARSGAGSEQMLELTFLEYFARLSGDVVCDTLDENNPFRSFDNVPAHEYVEDLINEFLSRSEYNGETINWDFGIVDTLANKSISYKDFPTVAKALCDAMNNISGAGKFDVVFRTDKDDYTHQFIDILKPRGITKNVIIKYPSDGVYKLWANGYELEETNDYASHVVIAGNGQIGDEDEMTAKIGTAQNQTFVRDYCYYRVYEPNSALESQNAVDDYAETRLMQLDFAKRVPEITLIGRAIDWGNEENEDSGLALGDIFYFQEDTDDGEDASGYYRIIGIETSWDDNGVDTTKLTLKEAE